MSCDPIKGCGPDTHNLHCGFPHCAKGEAQKLRASDPAPEATTPRLRCDHCGRIAPLDGEIRLGQVDDECSLGAFRLAAPHGEAPAPLNAAQQQELREYIRTPFAAPQEVQPTTDDDIAFLQVVARAHRFREAMTQEGRSDRADKIDRAVERLASRLAEAEAKRERCEERIWQKVFTEREQHEAALRRLSEERDEADAMLFQVRANYAQSLQNSNDDIGQLHRQLARLSEERQALTSGKVWCVNVSKQWRIYGKPGEYATADEALSALLGRPHEMTNG